MKITPPPPVQVIKFLGFAVRKFIVIFVLVLLSTNTILAAESFEVPTIAVYPDVYYPLEDVIYLEGRAEPSSAVQISFQKHGIKPVNLNTKSNSNGEWVLIEKVPLEEGNWEVRARIIASSGETSLWSNPRALKVIVTGIVIGGVTIKFAFLLFLLFVVLAVSAISIYYFASKTRRAIRDKEKQSVKKCIEKNFTELRSDIIDEIDYLEKKIKNNEKLTGEEEERRIKLLREISDAEQEIEDKLRDL